jgi:DNA helicase-4
MHEPSGQDRYQALLDELYRLIKISSEIGLKIPSVQILVRTKKTAPKGVDPEVLEEIAIKFRGQLDITWNSVHGSKGLEADFVVIPGLDSGKRGFPEDRPPEPLFDLILPEISDPVEEERRLLYVGLTRARHQAVLLADAERPSPFLFELKSVSQGTADIEWVESETKRTACPRCTIGSLHKPYEKANFRACSRSYSCGHREHKKK